MLWVTDKGHQVEVFIFLFWAPLIRIIVRYFNEGPTHLNIIWKPTVRVQEDCGLLGNYLKEKRNYIEHFNCITRAKLIHLSGVIDPASNSIISDCESIIINIILSYLLSQQKGDARVAFKN